jgi:NADPH:quinone reductase-like Zn-dependent oxidoreductase
MLTHRCYFAELVVAEEAHLGLAPPSLKPQDAATLPLVGMTTLAAYGLSDASVGVPAATWRAGPSTLVIGGTGGCGSVGIQLAKALGASHIYATGSDAAYMQGLGADTAWDYRKTDWWTALRNDIHAGYRLRHSWAGGRCGSRDGEAADGRILRHHRRKGLGGS